VPGTFHFSTQASVCSIEIKRDDDRYVAAIGHDAADGSMRDWYDNPRLEDIFEEQSAKLPDGPLGLLEPPEIKLISGLSPKAVTILQTYLSGKIGTMEFASRIEALRLEEFQSLKV
jgi:hypothetical protein